MSNVYNANTVDGDLVTDRRIKEVAITVLQNKLAPLSAFTRQFSTKPLSPKSVVQVEVVTAGGTVAEDATNFEDADKFVVTTTNVSVEPVQLTAGGHITNAEHQGGSVLDHWIATKAGELGDAVMDKVGVLLTAANFGAAPINTIAANFGSGDLQTLWNLLKKADVKSCVLDGDFFARFLPSNLTEINGAKVGMPGWQNFELNTRWDAAEATVAGFACSPDAIAVAMGLPEVAPGSERYARVGTFQLPGLDIKVQTWRWFSTSTRTGWFTFDIFFGAAVAQAGALKLIKRAS